LIGAIVWKYVKSRIRQIKKGRKKQVSNQTQWQAGRQVVRCIDKLDAHT
jgi:hypothetical protein